MFNIITFDYYRHLNLSWGKGNFQHDQVYNNRNGANIGKSYQFCAFETRKICNSDDHLHASTLKTNSYISTITSVWWISQMPRTRNHDWLKCLFLWIFCSARLALPGPEEKSIISSTVPITSENFTPNILNLTPPFPQLEGSTLSQEPTTITAVKNNEPIIEEPATPENICPEIEESAIEEAFLEDPDEIPTIKLNFEEFTQNLQNYMQANNMELQEADMSKALVALTPEAASIPMPKLKNISRLRTEHQVYVNTHKTNHFPVCIPANMRVCKNTLPCWYLHLCP